MFISTHQVKNSTGTICKNCDNFLCNPNTEQSNKIR